LVRYRLVRLPEEVYKKYYGIKMKMEQDIGSPLSMPKVFNALVDPNYNPDLIEINLGKLRDISRKRRWM